MRLPIRAAILGKPSDYAARVLRTRPYNLIGYWPLSELVGAVAKDLSPEGNNGAYTGVDLGQAGIGDDRRAPWWDGANDYCDIYSAGLASDFDGAAGTLLVWLKPNSAAIWTDGALRRAVTVRADGSNQVSLRKTTTDNEFVATVLAGGAGINSTLAPLGGGWHCVAVTWSTAANAATAYLNSVATVSGPYGTWAGALSSTQCCMGSLNTTPSEVWHGWLSHCALWNVALTPAEITALGRL